MICVMYLCVCVCVCIYGWVAGWSVLLCVSVLE